MGGSVILRREGPLEHYTFRGSPAEAGRAQGALGSDAVQERLAAWLSRPHNFEHPYFRKNMAFMRREFSDFMAQMEAFGEAAGCEDFDQTYYLHLSDTGREEEGCSAFGILLAEDGPAMMRTYDPSNPTSNADLLKDRFLAAYPDFKPHGFVGMSGRRHCVVHTSVNDAGLLLGWASGHPKFNWSDNPETINMLLVYGLVPWHCADCEDVRHFLSQYRTSGVKGVTGAAVDAKGNMVGLELESENIAFREPTDGMVLETNHWQHPDLQAPARREQPDFWMSPYYYNSQNRAHYVEYYRETFKAMRTLEELIDFSFDVDAPGRILQKEDTCIANWMTSHAFFMTSRDRRMRAYAYPLAKDQYSEIEYAG